MRKNFKKYITILGLIVCIQSTLFAQGTLLSDTIDVTNYEIHLDISDFTWKTISGYTVVTLTPKMNGISTIPLELWDLIIDSISIHNTGISATGYNYNGLMLSVGTTVPLMKTDTLQLYIAYHGHPVVDPSGWGGFLFQSGIAFNLGVGFGADPHNLGKTWFPCVDDFVDRASYDFYITTLTQHKAACGGEFVTSYYANQDSTKMTHVWELDKEIPTYLASVAVSNYTVLRDTFQGLERMIPVALYVQPQYVAPMQGSFINLNNAFDVFEEKFGPYQWDRIGYVQTPVGAMEHVDNIAYPTSLLSGSTTGETTMAHELSHSWFGNLVTCESAENMWINEGWASYCESIFIEYVYGKEEFKLYVRQNHANNLRTLEYTEGWMAIDGIPTELTYSSTVYDKGADIVHNLRGYLGDDLFFQVVKELMVDSAFEDVSSTELRDYLTSKTGIDLNPFFDTYVFSPGWVHFSIDSMSVIHEAVWDKPTVYVRQRTIGGSTLANNNRVEVTFMDDYWNKQTELITFDGDTGSQQFSLPFAPTIAILDMEERLSDASTDHYEIFNQPAIGTYDDVYFKYEIINVVDSALLRVEQNWIAPDPFKTAHPDLMLSTSRYWKVDGILPSGFEAKFKFNYNNKVGGSGWLDNDWFPYPLKADSLVLLYREGTADDWMIVESVRAGTSRIGYLATDFNGKGEYTLAYRDGSLLTQETTIQSKSVLKVFPNPAKNMVTIDICHPEKGILQLIDSSGKVLESEMKRKYQRQVKIDTMKHASGNYIVQFITGKQELFSQRLIITH
jgi:hypothetical protein